MLKKKICWLLMIVLMCSFFAGCKAKSDSEEENVIDDKYRMYYEVFVYSFCDSNGDGIGDLNGLISKLDYIEELGCNGIWLMPVMPSTTYHKYDVIDYYDIDAQYGTMEDFENLIAECNKRGIRVIIDLVFNHTSAQNKWFLDAVEYLNSLEPGEEPNAAECPYVEYYNFKKDAALVSGYHELEGTEWYYEGIFWDKMPDLNLDNEAVRKEIEDITTFWLNKGVYGFRLDATKEYFSGNNTKNLEVLSWYSDFVKEQDPDAYLVAEVWDTFSVISSYYTSGIDSIFNYTFGNYDGRVIKTLNAAGDGEAGVKFANSLVAVQDEFLAQNPDMIDAPFLSNHDTGRIAGFLVSDEDRIKLAGAMNILMSGSAFLYYGEELGMSGSGKDENKRLPMYWNDEKNNGMTTPSPDMEERKHKFGSYETQKEDPYSIYSYYKQVIHLRNKYPQIARGTVAVMDAVEDGDICAVSKTWEGETIYLLYNISPEEKEVSVSAEKYSYHQLADSLCTGEDKAKLDGETVKIPAYGVVILR